MIFRLPAVIIAAMLIATSLTASAVTYRVGAGSVVITPEEPMWMAGYASRQTPSEGTLLDIYAKALVIEDTAGAKSVVVSLDLTGVSAECSKRVSELIEDKYSIPRANLMMTASHTHSGPVVRDNLIHMYGLSDEEANKVTAYTEALPGRIVQAIDAAMESIEPCALHWGIGNAGFAMNRREYTPTGVINRMNPIGPVDHDVPVLVARRADGTAKAILFGYACHNTTLSIMQWSGDYAGFAQANIEEAVPGATALFVTGAGADANPLPRRTVELAKKYGHELADAVLETLSGDLSPVSGEVRARFKEIPLELSPAPSREEVEAQLKDENVYIQRRAQHLLQTIDEKGAIPETYPYPVQVWQFGDSLQIVALGGELTVDYALLIKHEFDATKQFVIGYANDVCAYIPSLRVLLEGGYEGESSMIYYGFHGPWAPSIEKDIMAAVRELATKE